MGSGVREVFRFTPLYTPGAKPEFIEEDVFITIIPLVSDTTQKTTQKTEDRIVEILLGDITEDGVKYHLDKLRKAGKIKHVGPDKGGYWKVIAL